MSAYQMTVSKKNCPYCDKAKALFAEEGIEVQVNVLDTREKFEAFKAEGFSTVPQIWEGDHHIGGYDDLVKHL